MLADALKDGFLGVDRPPKSYLNKAVLTCNEILDYVASTDNYGADLSMIAFHCDMNRNSAAQYTRVLEDLKLLEVQHIRGDKHTPKNLYLISYKFLIGKHHV